jgi:uncharacterized protein involved in exopolysaccharide biosynthesis
MSKKKKSYYFELVDVVKFISRWKRPLIYVSALAAVLSIVFSSPFVIKPRFLSKAVFYPTSNYSISAAILSDSRVKGKDPFEFGEQVSAQQFVQILESEYLKSKVISRYNLLDRYYIDQNDKEKKYKIGKLYDEYISIKKTPYASIEVSVLDEDPNKASEIANGIIETADSVKAEVQRKVAMQALFITEQQYKNKEDKIAAIEGRMKEIGAKGVYSYEDQSEAVTVLASKGADGAYIKKQQDALALYGAEAFGLKSQLQYETESLTELSKKLECARVDVNSVMSNVFVISHAVPADKKAYPVRWLIVFVSTIGAFVLGCIVLLIVEKYQNQKANYLD